MKTDTILVSSRGREMETALKQAEKAAAYKGLGTKSALQLRLLTEEMMGLMRSITGETEGTFWIEDEEGVYQLHLKTENRMDEKQKEELIAVSSEGRNEAAKGLMGKIRAFFEPPMDGTPMPEAITDTRLPLYWPVKPIMPRTLFTCSGASR